jgi:hypothetical protein
VCFVLAPRGIESIQILEFATEQTFVWLFCSMRIFLPLIDPFLLLVSRKHCLTITNKKVFNCVFVIDSYNKLIDTVVTVLDEKKEVMQYVDALKKCTHKKRIIIISFYDTL